MNIDTLHVVIAGSMRKLC